MNTQELTKSLSPLQPFMDDPEITEIMVDRYDRVYVERHGQFEDVTSPFKDEQQLLDVIRETAVSLGRPLGDDKMMDARLPDGSRFNAVLPPVAIHGPSLTIRLFRKLSLTFDQLIEYDAISQPIIDFLRACVEGKINIVVSGGTGSGKTTLLNAIIGLIPPNERIVTVESAMELQPPETLKRVVRLESQSDGAISMRDLVVNAMKMRPDRLIIGEIMAGEALDMLHAMNTGHDGGMISMHATGARDVLTRLETMVYMATPSLPLLQVRQHMASAIDLIVHAERLGDGSRKVMRVSEVTGMKGDVIVLQDILKFAETGEENGRIVGNFPPTGYIPTFVKKIHAAGMTVPMSLFHATE